MAHLLIDSFESGWQTSQAPFSIAEDAFAVLDNAIVDHNRVARNVGYKQIGITTIEVTGSLSFTLVETNYVGDLTTLLSNIPESHSKLIASNSVTITLPNTTLSDSNGTFPSGSIDYTTGMVSLDSSVYTSLTTAQVTFSYHPMLPTTGIARISDEKHLLFDTSHAYAVSDTVGGFQMLPRDSSYFSSGSLCTFTGASHRLFSFVDVNNRIFCANGVAGRHVVNITNISQATEAVVTITSGNIAEDDLIFFNEVEGMTEINGYTAKVIGVTGNRITTDLNTVAFSTYSTGGILQILTSDGTGTGIKYYYRGGFVNFAPPLNASGTPTYLWGAKTVLYYNNTLIFFGTYEGTSSGTIEYHPLRVRYSATGQVFYSTHPDLGSFAIGNSTADAWRDDVITLTLAGGNGGFLDLQADAEEIAYARILKNYIVVGLNRGMVRLQFNVGIASFIPFFYSSVLGSFSPQGAVHLDDRIISLGGRGIIATDEQSIKRIDQSILSEFENTDFSEFSILRNTASRDIKREFAYLSYAEDMDAFPTKSFVYNYNNNTFASFDEKLTCQGEYNARDLPTWRSVATQLWGTTSGTWGQFTDSSLVINTAIGTSQGVLLAREENQAFDYSVLIEGISSNNDNNTSVVTSRNHSMKVGDFIYIPQAFEEAVRVTSVNESSFTVDRATNRSYNGVNGGIFIPQVSIRTKAFRPFWRNARRTNLLSVSLLLEANEEFIFSLNLYSDQNFEELAETSMLLPSSKGSQENVSPVRWVKSIYSNYEADSIQVDIGLDESQIRQNPLQSYNFILHSILLDLEEGGELA